MVLLVLGVVLLQAKEDYEIEQKIGERIARFAQLNCLSEAQVCAYNAAFKVLDIDGDGTVDSDEMQLGLASIGIDFQDPEHLLYYLRQVDDSNNGLNSLDRFEFLEFM